MSIRTAGRAGTGSRGKLLELLEGGSPQSRPVSATTDIGEAMG
ncbi:hypothetical protein [Streptomyces sp. WAC 06725]|nr:hypothetical protein [Streptomyces sp. WAC 06725]